MTTSRDWGRATWLLVAGATLARIVYLAWFCPIELVGDEAQYWDWSRRLDLSYYSKGPGVAWTIAASTKLLGTHEWSVRLPAVLFGAVGALGIAAVANRIARRQALVDKPLGAPIRETLAGFLAAAMFLLIPAYQATGLLMTIDGPYVACWVLACLCAWRWWETDSSAGAIRWSAALGAALGVGFLFKYTILLLIPGLVLFAWAMRRRKEEAPRSRSGFFATAVGVACCTVVFAAVISPVIIWNAREGWPTVAHLLGHVGAAGGDRPDLAAEKWSYDPKWTLELVGSQIGFVGPMLALMGLALRRGFARSADEVFRGAARLGLWAGAPILAFYFVLTFFAEGEANWPIAGYAAMIAPAAVLVARSRPLKNPVRGLWHWSIGYGLATGIGLMLIVPASHLPVVGKYVPLHRFSGWRDTAMKVYEVAEASPADGSESEPFVIARRYDATARLAFYMPGRPSVFCAGPYMGDRKSSYDFFPDTDLHAKELIGRRAVLVGASAEQWAEVFRFERVEAREAGAGRAVYVGVGYGGPAAGGPTK